MLLLVPSSAFVRQYTTLQYNTIQYNTIQYNTIQYNSIQHNTIEKNTIQYSVSCFSVSKAIGCQGHTGLQGHTGDPFRFVSRLAHLKSFRINKRFQQQTCNLIGCIHRENRMTLDCLSFHSSSAGLGELWSRDVAIRREELVLNIGGVAFRNISDLEGWKAIHPRCRIRKPCSKKVSLKLHILKFANVGYRHHDDNDQDAYVLLPSPLDLCQESACHSMTPRASFSQSSPKQKQHTI